jgi:hypothetical protein
VVDYCDMSVVRSVARQAARNNHRFSSFVLAIVKSPPFLMRRSEDSDPVKTEFGGVP